MGFIEGEGLVDMVAQRGWVDGATGQEAVDNEAGEVTDDEYRGWMRRCRPKAIAEDVEGVSTVVKDEEAKESSIGEDKLVK